MSIPGPLRRTLAAAGCLLALGACATTTPPPRFGTVSPADPGAPEAASPAAAPMLTGQGELAEKATGATGSTPSANEVERHEHQGPDAADAPYTCPMHPEVTATEPGKCPVCGMALTRRAKAPEDLP